MADKYDSRHTTILAELREQAGLTQDQAAGYFGLDGHKRRDSVGSWERGGGRPRQKLRAKFIEYLLDELRLRYSPEMFTKVWTEVMVKQWHWLPLSQAETLALQAPFQAIADLPYFVGREPELQTLMTALTAGRHTVICSVQGMGGVGKTALAAHAAYQLRSKFPDGVLWARLDTSDAMSILATFAQAYHTDVSQYPDLDSRSRVVRSLLANRRVLIILDNVENNAQLQALLPPSTGSCAVLVTTRHTTFPALLGADWIHLGPFHSEQPEALDLFAKVLGAESVKRQQSIYQEIADRLGHLPLAVAIAAGRIVQESDRSAAKFLEMLRAATTRLDELTFGDWSVRLSFGISYAQLAPDRQRFFAALGAFGGTDFDTEAVARVADTPVSDARDRLLELYNLSLLQLGRKGRFRLHPLLRDYAREKIVDETVYARMAEHYLNVLIAARTLYDQGGETLKQGLTLFDDEVENIQAGQSWAEAHALEERAAASLCCEYPLAGGAVLRLRLSPHERIHWCTVGLATARRLERSDVEGRLLAVLGLAHSELGENQQALEYFEQALAIFRKSRDRDGECSVLGDSGLTYVRLGDYPHAITCLKRARSLAHQTRQST